MRRSIAGRPCRINVIETEDDVPLFKDFVRRNKVLSYDTEGTSLSIFSSAYRLRLVQFGAGTESWVLPIEKGPRYAYLAKITLEYAEQLICTNATYDLLIADAHLGVPLELTYPKTVDTGILSRLVDSRAAHEGGTGHSLEDLTAAYVDKVVAAEIKGSVREMAKELKTTKSKFWSVVPIDHEGYLLYAGMDPILTWAQRSVLTPKIPGSARKLVPYEHELAMICAMVERRGYLLDLDYTRRMADQLDEEQEGWERRAAELGLENVNSPKQVAEAFMRDGWQPEDFTPSGQPKVDKRELDRLVEKGYELAICVQRAKRANKWNSAYFKTFLEEVDPQGRIHPSIHTMQARTARMSITRPALQTLPSSESMVRHAFLAEVGHVTGSIDYANMELRVMAARAGDKVMIDAFMRDLDLHQITADAANVSRKGGKTGNFSKAFGGGAKAIADGAGVPLEVGQRISDAFDETYKGVTAYSKKLMKEARQNGYITTMTGRRLYVDKARAYSALNYDVQSSSRDITGRGIIRIHKAGMTDYIRLPIHDEVVASLPEANAKELAIEIGRCMESSVNGLPIPTDPEVGGRSWGSLYEKAA